MWICVHQLLCRPSARWVVEGLTMSGGRGWGYRVGSVHGSFLYQLHLGPSVPGTEWKERTFFTLRENSRWIRKAGRQAGSLPDRKVLLDQPIWRGIARQVTRLKALFIGPLAYLQGCQVSALCGSSLAPSQFKKTPKSWQEEDQRSHTFVRSIDLKHVRYAIFRMEEGCATFGLLKRNWLKFRFKWRRWVCERDFTCIRSWVLDFGLGPNWPRSLKASVQAECGFEENWTSGSGSPVKQCKMLPWLPAWKRSI